MQQHSSVILARSTVLARRYEILKVLGHGGMSTVYAARDLRFSSAVKLCAIKEMVDLSSSQPERLRVLELFEREANLLAELSHPSIPKVYDYFSENKRSYLVIEFIDGQDLENLLSQTTDPMPESRVVSWAVQICDVLAYLHNHEPQPIIFRDMKPSNVMLTRDARIMLIDFGIAKIFQNVRKGTMIGTEGYAPPEQYRGLAEPRGDLYALGAMMHHLLTRSDPRMEAPFTFHERSPRMLNPQVTVGVEQVVMKALSYTPEERFSSAVEMRDALLAALGSSPVSTNMLPRRSTGVAITPLPAAPAIAPVASPLAEEPRLRWHFPTGDEVRATPAIVGNVVFIGSYDTHLYALDVSDGTVRWKVPTGGGVVTRAAVAGEAVVFGSEDGRVYAVRAADGRTIWSATTGASVRSSPCLAGDTVVVGSDDGTLYALDLATGQEKWVLRTWRPLRSSPTVAEGLAYIGSEDNYIYAVDMVTGAAKWKYQTLRGITSSPAVVDGFVVIGSMDGHIYCFDALAGWLVWKFKTGHYVVSSPRLVGGIAYCGSVDGFMYAIEVKTGKAAWRFKADGQITSSAVVERGRLYFGCVDTHIYCLDARNGTLIWKFKAGGPVPGSPAVAGEALVFGSTDKEVYALTML